MEVILMKYKIGLDISSISYFVLLKNNKIEFIPQFKIPGNNYKFRYDFFLPDYNLLIEFHGKQHYEPVEIFGGEEEFKNIFF